MLWAKLNLISFKNNQFFLMQYLSKYIENIYIIIYISSTTQIRFNISEAGVFIKLYPDFLCIRENSVPI